MIDSNNQLKTLSKSLLNAVRGVMEATKDPTHPKTDKHKDLAAKAPPHDKITHADVLVGRGVLKKHPTTGKLVTKEEVEEVTEKLSDEAKTAIRFAAGGIGAKVKPLVKLAQMGKKPMGEEVNPAHYDIAGLIKKAKAKGDPKHPAMKHVAALEDIKKHGGAMSVQGDHVRSLIKALGEEAQIEEGEEKGGGYDGMPKGLEDRSPRGRARNAMGRAIVKKERNLARARKEIASRNEEVEELDELSKGTMGRYINKAKDQIDATSYKQGIRDNLGANSPAAKAAERKLSKRHKGISTAVKKLTSEESEQIDELSVVGLDKYHSKAYQSMFDKDSDKKTVAKRKKGMDTAYNKAGFGKAKVYATEEAEDLDEALDAAARYGQHHVAIKELMKSISQHVESHKNDALKHRDYRGKKGVHWGHVGDVAQIHSQLADIHDRLAQQGEYKKSMAESVEDYDVDQIDELSTSTLQGYRKKARAQGNAIIDKMKMGGGDWSKDQKDTKTLRKRSFGANASGKQLVKRGESLKTEDLELDEARGRPRKNPLPVGDVEPEPRQHIIQQLQRAKLSMRGGEDVTFKNGKKGHVSGPHASKILSRYAGMRPSEKEDFQKKIGASHEAFKEHL